MRARELQQGLAENPALPSELVSRLIAGADDELAYCLALRDDLEPEQVRALAGRSDDLAVMLARRGLLEAGDVDGLARPYAAIGLIEEGRGRDEWAIALAGDPDIEIRLKLAACPRLPDEVNLLLAADPDAKVVTELAYFTAASDLLVRLATHPDADVRAAVASNSATPPAVLADLVAVHWRRAGEQPVTCEVCVREPIPFVHDPNCPRLDCDLPPGAACDGTHQSAIHNLLVKAVDNSETPVSAVVDLAKHPSMLVRWALAARDDLPAGPAEKLAADPSSGVRAAVAPSPALSETTIRRLADDDGQDVRWRLARNPGVPLDVLAGLGRIRGGSEVLPRIAAAGPDEVRELATSLSPQLRMLLAERRDLPPDIRDQLARDPDAKVVKAVAPHPGIPEELLREMVSRHGARVIVRVVVNPDAPPGLLLDLVRHLPPVQKVFREIARRADAPADVLELCLADVQARPIAAAHPALPPGRIVELLADGEDRVATAAATNPALPETEMIRLSDPVL